ncbi:MAG: tetratricopeptide repeat protein [Gemmatimonadota bacterium]|nr:MAG: tetratricopeptide repeat protein [Gemmatimonadota bacterium]
MVWYKPLIGALAVSVVVGCGGQPEELEPLDLYDAALFFSSGRDRERYPRMSLVRDSVNNRIAVLCLGGASLAELEELGIDDLGERLTALEEGKILNLVGESCSIAFPAFVGSERERLAEIADAAALQLSPLVGELVGRLRVELGDREDMLFHVLWSRVIDEIWSVAWRAPEPGMQVPVVAWVVYPEHVFAVGTNYGSAPGGGDLALTWSNNFTDHLSAFPDANYELFKTASGEPFEDAEVRAELETYGIFDANGDSRLFSLHRDEHLDSVLAGMVTEYGEAVARTFDWGEIGARLDIHPGDAYIVVLHEVAYAIFERLYRAGTLEIPLLLLDGTDKTEAVRLASLWLDEPPGPLDEATALFMANGWHGSEEAVAAFEEARRAEPEHVRLHWFLGLSLYDIERYEEALAVFEQLIQLTAGDADELLWHDWGRIWMGHVYDVTGDRARALASYRSVLDAEHSGGTLQTGQYDIGPVTAKEWAAERIDTPFVRKN